MHDIRVSEFIENRTFDEIQVGDAANLTRITLTCTRKFDHNKHMIFDCVCTNQDALQVIRGQAEG